MQKTTNNEEMLKNLSKAEFDNLAAGGEAIMVEYGLPKVIALPDRRMIKLFRRKHFFSSQLWKSYARRFADNARALSKLGFKTVEIDFTFKVPEIQRNGVVYQLLEGDTLRDWLADKTSEVQNGKIAQLGGYVSRMHQAGILFRSLHLGNVVVTDSGDFGLIDISDMTFKSSKGLTISERIRNFHHMDRYDFDRKIFLQGDCQYFLESYTTQSKLTGVDKHRIESEFKSIFLNPTSEKTLRAPVRPQASTSP